MTVDMAGFAAALGTDDLPEALLALLRRSFLDTMGVAAIGSTTGLSRIARKGALALFGPGEAGAARMLMDGRRVSPAGSGPFISSR